MNPLSFRRFNQSNKPDWLIDCFKHPARDAHMSWCYWYCSISWETYEPSQCRFCHLHFSTEEHFPWTQPLACGMCFLICALQIQQPQGATINTRWCKRPMNTCMKKDDFSSLSRTETKSFTRVLQEWFLSDCKICLQDQRAEVKKSLTLLHVFHF